MKTLLQMYNFGVPSTLKAYFDYKTFPKLNQPTRSHPCVK